MSKCIVLLYGLLIMIVFAGIVDAEPSILIEPSSQHREHEVTVSGSGFTPGVTLHIVYDGDPEGGNLFGDFKMIVGKKGDRREIIVAEDGNFSFRTRVEGGSRQKGIYEVGVVAISSITRESAFANFEILPGILWTVPSSGPPGTNIKIYGEHFHDSAGVADLVKFDSGFLWGRDGLDESLDACQNYVEHWGYKINWYYFDDIQACTDNYYIPGDATPGWHKVTVIEDGGVSADFYVTPPTPVPEYPTIALPLILLIGLVFMLHRYRINK